MFCRVQVLTAYGASRDHAFIKVGLPLSSSGLSPSYTTDPVPPTTAVPVSLLVPDLDQLNKSALVAVGSAGLGCPVWNASFADTMPDTTWNATEFLSNQAVPEPMPSGHWVVPFLMSPVQFPVLPPGMYNVCYAVLDDDDALRLQFGWQPLEPLLTVAGPLHYQYQQMKPVCCTPAPCVLMYGSKRKRFHLAALGLTFLGTLLALLSHLLPRVSHLLKVL